MFPGSFFPRTNEGEKEKKEPMSKIRGLPPEVREPEPGVELGVEDGLLCQLIHSPEFNLFSESAVFESNFTQVTKPGNWLDVYDRSTTVILGVTSSVAALPLPNILLMANVTWPHGQLSTSNKPVGTPAISLSRILPLRYVELQIYDRLQRILRLRTVTEKIYYLRLHEKHPEAVFQFWIRLVKILKKGLSITTKDPRIQFTHCLVPKIAQNCDPTPESSPVSSSQPSESSMLLAAEQSYESFSDLSKRSILTQDSRNTDITIDLTGLHSQYLLPIREESPTNLKVTMRTTLSHSLWEQENSDEHFIQAPVASALGQNFLGP